MSRPIPSYIELSSTTEVDTRHSSLFTRLRSASLVFRVFSLTSQNRSITFELPEGMVSIESHDVTRRQPSVTPYKLIVDETRYSFRHLQRDVITTTRHHAVDACEVLALAVHDNSLSNSRHEVVTLLQTEQRHAAIKTEQVRVLAFEDDTGTGSAQRQDAVFLQDGGCGTPFVRPFVRQTLHTFLVATQLLLRDRPILKKTS